MKLWDTAFRRQYCLTSCKLLRKTVFTDQAGPVSLCDFIVLPDGALCDHFRAEHTDLPHRPEFSLALFVTVSKISLVMVSLCATDSLCTMYIKVCVHHHVQS